MHRFLRPHIRIRQQGQTLVIALIVMGVLLILGLVFLGLINRNILNAARSQRRSEATDLAEAGIRYAHAQLVSSPLGADWRGVPWTLTETAPGSNLTLDPDAYYLRPASGLPNDLGGPDRLGPFIRLLFPGGRSLTRVRWGATDATPAPSVPGGPLRNPGAARSTLIIESVGRPGVVNTSDPTTLNVGTGAQFQGFANDLALTQGLARLAQLDGQVRTSRREVAFAPIGIIDFARFETNLYNSSAPIDIGIPDGLGVYAFDDVRYQAGPTNPANIGSQPVEPNLSLQLGTPGGLTVVTRSGNSGRFGGSLMANGNLRINGQVKAYLNRTLGDGIRAAGQIQGGNNGALSITTVQYNPATSSFQLYNPLTNTYVATEAAATVTLTGNGTPSFDSQNPNFNTAGGQLLDGSPRTDAAGFASGVGALVPPSAFSVDPQTKLNRYVAMTRESGVSVGSTNSGAFGHGAGVYVNNAADRQEPADAEGRRAVGSQRSLFDDWLNPNSGAANTGWKGPFYVPVSAVVQLLPDGFVIQRNGAGPADQRTWKGPDGSETGRTTLRYRVGRGTDGSLRIVNATQVADINAATIDFNAGLPFNGILYFEGNVRVRGTIPTAVQLTLVSGATIYIDGSITKGVSNNDVTGGTRGQTISGLPTATLMLMAKDNVAVNTPNFFGPIATQAIQAANDNTGATGISPLVLQATGSATESRLELVHELALDPNDPTTGNFLTNAGSWRPYALNYRRFDNNSPITSQMLLGLTMDDGTAAASFIAMDVNEGSGTSSYLFPAYDGLITNAAATYLYADAASAPPIPLYGLGAEPWQRYSKFELRSFPLLDPASATYSNTGVIGGMGYTLQSGGNYVLLRPGSLSGVSANDTLIGRAAVTPADVRIEASIYAEQGSFFVIPGPWFSPNPNDTHVAYARSIAEYVGKGLSLASATVRADRDRLEAYGAAPAAPFYGEPLDVKLTLIGSVAENLPPPLSVQAEWLRKWGWIPRRLGATGVGIPRQHVPNDANPATQNFVSNLVIQYDPVLASGRLNDPASPTPVRTDGLGRPLPPMPRLPVSPKLAYFGEL